jgi:hypothetical protein
MQVMLNSGDSGVIGADMGIDDDEQPATMEAVVVTFWPDEPLPRCREQRGYSG